MISGNKVFVKSTENSVVDISKELQLESEYTINHGIFNKKDLDSLLGKFTQNYSDYLGENYNLLFVYGDSEGVNYTSYQKVDSGGISLDLGGEVINVATTSGRIETGGKTPTTANNKKVTILVNGISYDFDLKDGENFFIVIQEPRKDILPEE